MLNADKPIASQIIDLVRAEGLAEGSHLKAQWLADRLRVSRSPINQALGLLQQKGLVRREPNRGYFLAQPAGRSTGALGLEQEDRWPSVYFRIANDRLRGVRFHQALVAGSGNSFFIDPIRRVNRVRRLLSHRSMQDRKRYQQHCRQHLQGTLRNFAKITDILTPQP